MKNSMAETVVKDLEKDCIKLFWPLFTQHFKRFTTKDWVEIDIYDIPTQFFVFWEYNSAVYSAMSDEVKQVIAKIIKDNNMSSYNETNITVEDITLFRKLFRTHPEMRNLLDWVSSKYDWVNHIGLLNTFFKEVVRLRIFSDEDLVALREFRVYVAKKTIEFEWNISDNLKNDLYYFLQFDRFNTDSYVKDKADKVLDKICWMIEDWTCPDMRYMKSYNDWDKIPNKVVSMIESLVLINYADKPDKTVVEETRAAVEMMDLDMLKEYMWFVPRWRQKYALIFESRENLAANSRRSWKSFLMTYIANRQIMLPWQMILYILPSKEDYSEQPFFYIEQMLENIKKKWAELPWFQFNAKQFRVVNKNMKSKILFISAMWSSKGKSFSANLVIEDEAWYISDWNVYEQAYNSTSDTKWRMWAVSTINVDTPINWFFYKKVWLDGMDDAMVVSVDIYNNPFLSPEEKKRKEQQYKWKDQSVWLADWMAIFVWWDDWFDISTFFQIDFIYDVVSFKWYKFNLARNLDKYERFLLAYDPAKNKDKAGIAVIWRKWNNAEVVMTWYINVKNYFVQWEVIMEMLSYIGSIKNIEFAIDLGKAWEAAFDRFESRKIAPYGVLSTWWSELTKKTYRRWNVPASIMESNLHSLMASGNVTWFSRLDNIRNEFETYNLSKDRSSKVDHHHDVLSALMLWLTVRYERGLVKFDWVRKEKNRREIIVDAYWRPVMQQRAWWFNPNIMSKFIH